LVALNRQYRDYHLPKNNKNPKYEHEYSDCVVALSIDLLPRTAQWTIGKNFEYYYGYICSQSEDDVRHLSVLDEVDANQKSEREQQFGPVSEMYEAEGFLCSAAQTAGLPAFAETDDG